MDQGANMVHNRYMTANCTGIIHVVKEGDTLYKIGKMHGVSVSALMYANPYVNIYNLQVGMNSVFLYTICHGTAEKNHGREQMQDSRRTCRAEKLCSSRSPG